MTTVDENTIKATLVPEADRLDFYPRFLKVSDFFRFETLVFSYMATFSAGYSGGMWDFYDLSNGGFYVAPKGEDNVIFDVASNWFQGELSPDAAGIVVTLYALNRLLSNGNQRYIEHYYNLLDYAAQHPEASKIRGAID